MAFVFVVSCAPVHPTNKHHLTQHYPQTSLAAHAHTHTRTHAHNHRLLKRKKYQQTTRRANNNNRMTLMEQDHKQTPSPSPEQEDITVHTSQEEEPEMEDIQGQEHAQEHHQPTTESSPPAEDALDVELESAELGVQHLDLQEPEQNTREGPTAVPSSSQQAASSDMLAPPSNTFANFSRQSSPNANAFAKRNSIASEAAATAAAAVKEPTIELTPRLVIEKMVLVNFKSYAGRQEIGPFHKSFTSVVGPNGSGKSNVIDALLFVFGYRANKMRQGKLSELIHNSKGAEDLESCTVEIHFCEILDLVSW